MRFSIIPSSLAGFVLLSSSGTPAAPSASQPRQPVVVELFTSEGCSSCPPADALLQKLDRDQPVPGAFAIVLSEHVDYWNNLGWKDPFSSPVFSRRQEAYSRRLHLDGVYTPQAVVDGTSEAVGSDSRQIQAGVLKASKAAKLPIQISEVFQNRQGVAAVHVQASPDKASGSAHLMIALAEDAAVSRVLRGENSGRRLEHVAVVRSLVDAGRVSGTFTIDVPLTGELGQWAGKRLVAFVQDQQAGPIQGAAVRLLSMAALAPTAAPGVGKATE